MYPHHFLHHFHINFVPNWCDSSELQVNTRVKPCTHITFYINRGTYWVLTILFSTTTILQISEEYFYLFALETRIKLHLWNTVNAWQPYWRYISRFMWGCPPFGARDVMNFAVCIIVLHDSTQWCNRLFIPELILKTRNRRHILENKM